MGNVSGTRLLANMQMILDLQLEEETEEVEVQFPKGEVIQETSGASFLQGPRGGGSEAHGTEGGPPYYCYNPACEHVQQFGECVRYKTPCKLADGSEPNNSNGPNRGGKTRGRGPRGGGQSQGSGGGPPYHCYNQ